MQPRLLTMCEESRKSPVENVEARRTSSPTDLRTTIERVG
jgi:hypothetical protein